MIQRLQTLFYFLSASTLAALFFLPFAESASPIEGYFNDQLFSVSDHPILVTLTAMGILGGLIAVFLYKNRTLQLRLGYLIITISVLIPCLSVWLLYSEETAFNGTVEIRDRLGMFLPVITIVLAVLANRFVKKDEQLIQSMDRLR
ncbi:MAG TPA: DUF4293 domain-containing protein [Saprospiraceae bacterium]|nr:DUF4293 domain-containing protein [Saprospiraceae bacterium]